MRNRLKIGVLAALLTVSTVVIAPPTTAATNTDALYVNWALWLPAYVSEFNPGSADDCVAGRDKCAAKTVREMQQLLDGFATGCSHNAVFSLAYTRISQGYNWIRGTGTTEQPYYQNVAGLNYIVEVFARTYLKWVNNRADGLSVPTAWEIAFDAAERKLVSGSGDLLLGINAHINRDLAFVVAAAGLVNPQTAPPASRTMTRSTTCCTS